jgi:hypothetical protein
MSEFGAITPEARMLNDGRDTLPGRMTALDDLDERRALTLYLPDGRVLDQAQLDDIAARAQTFAPFIIRRTMLAIAGARNIGHAMILRAEELERLRDYVAAVSGRKDAREVQAWRELTNPVRPYEL